MYILGKGLVCRTDRATFSVTQRSFAFLIAERKRGREKERKRERERDR